MTDFDDLIPQMVVSKGMSKRPCKNESNSSDEDSFHDCFDDQADIEKLEENLKVLKKSIFANHKENGALRRAASFSNI